MLVLLTPESFNRQWIVLEVGAAWGRRKNYRIIVVLCHAGVDTIPAIISSKKAYSINVLDEYLTELKRRVEKHMS
jgi:hypothetical protein